MRNCLTWALAMSLKDDFTDDMRAAWVHIFDTLSMVVIEGLESCDENFESDSDTTHESKEEKHHAPPSSTVSAHQAHAKDKEKEKVKEKAIDNSTGHSKKKRYKDCIVM